MYLIKTPLLWESIHFANPRVLSISVPLWVSWKLLFITTFPNAGFTTPSFQFALFQITFQFPQSYLDPSKKNPYSSSDLAQPRSLACLSLSMGYCCWCFLTVLIPFSSKSVFPRTGAFMIQSSSRNRFSKDSMKSSFGSWISRPLTSETLLLLLCRQPVAISYVASVGSSDCSNPSRDHLEDLLSPSHHSQNNCFSSIMTSLCGGSTLGAHLLALFSHSAAAVTKG